MAWLCVCFDMSSTCGDLLPNVIGKNREIDEEYHKDCVEEGDVEGGREALVMGNFSINTWDGTKL